VFTLYLHRGVGGVAIGSGIREATPQNIWNQRGSIETSGIREETPNKTSL
jgi:hypothetical protein